MNISSNYASLLPREDYSKKKAEKEMLNCCLPGSFMNCQGGLNYQGMGCSEPMSDKCSTKWDYNCDMYVSNLTYQEGVNFLDSVATKRYCINDSPGCKTKTALSNPLNPNSYSEHFMEGVRTFFKYKGKEEKSCSRNSPAYIQSCQDAAKCSKKRKTDFTADDPVYQRCLTWNACKDVLKQIPYNQRSHINGGVIFEGYLT